MSTEEPSCSACWSNLHPIGRHDNPEEKINDEIRAEINASHRFQSFAAERSDNFVKWYVAMSSAFEIDLIDVFSRHIDGHDYMWAVSEIIDSAKEAIFILVSPLCKSPISWRIIYFIQGLVAHPGALPSSPTGLSSRMEVRQIIEAQGRAGGEDLRGSLQGGSSATSTSTPKSKGTLYL